MKKQRQNFVCKICDRIQITNISPKPTNQIFADGTVSTWVRSTFVDFPLAVSPMVTFITNTVVMVCIPMDTGAVNTFISQAHVFEFFTELSLRNRKLRALIHLHLMSSSLQSLNK